MRVIMGSGNSTRMIGGVTAVILLTVAYVLSYAPVVRLNGSWTVQMVPNWNGRVYPIKAPLCGTTGLPVYRPVDWLIDHTPMREPLWTWAELWGVRTVFTEAVFWR